MAADFAKYDFCWLCCSSEDLILLFNLTWLNQLIGGISSSVDSVECFQGSITDPERKQLVMSDDQFESSKRLKIDDNSSESEMCLDKEQSVVEANSESEEEDLYENYAVSASPTELSKSTYSETPSISDASFQVQSRKMVSRKQTPLRFGPSPASHSVNSQTTNSSDKCDGDSSEAAASVVGLIC